MILFMAASASQHCAHHVQCKGNDICCTPWCDKATVTVCFLLLQYLVFEYVEKTLLEVLEAQRGGLGPEEVGSC
jgi:hypothetical protein